MRSLCRLPARPQWPAPVALGHHEERLHHPGLGNRRLGLQARGRHRQGSRRPGQILAVDTETGQVLHSDDIDNRLKSRHPCQAVAAAECAAHPGDPGRRPWRGQLRRRPAQAIHEDVPGHLRGA
ncbi:hypothetical protein ACPA9J_05910 [Pseudomonas aeruginosa]